MHVTRAFLIRDLHASGTPLDEHIGQALVLAKAPLETIDFIEMFEKYDPFNRVLPVTLLVAALGLSGCGGKPDEQGLRKSFAQQLAANSFVRDFQQNGDDLIFSGPGPEGGTAQWRVHIDSAVVEPDPTRQQSYRGNVKSSWRANGRLFRPRGRDSNLPLELTSTGLAQECWAVWDGAARKWGWE